MKIELPGNIFASKDNEPYCHSLMLDGFLYCIYFSYRKFYKHYEVRDYKP